MHKAGRELDALVAERVMGYRAPKNGWFKDIPHRVAEERGDDYLRPVDFLSKYSTDIIAAWEVMENLYKRDFACKVFIGWKSGERFQKEDWVAEVTDNNDKYLGVATSAPHAICLAALQTVETK